MSYIFNTFFYNPLYNALVGIIDLVPHQDAGVGVVLLTILVSLLLFGVSKKAIRTQIKLKEIEPEIKRIKENFKDKKEEQARLMIDLYKKHEINPFSLIFFVLIQIPILIALYYIFWKGGLPMIKTDILYSFVPVPQNVSMNFLGILDITQKSIVLAVISGITQFIQAYVATPSIKTPEKDVKDRTFGDDFQKSMHMQMKYVFPVVIGVIGATLPAALPLYWSTRNIFMTVQEIFVKKGLKLKK